MPAHLARKKVMKVSIPADLPAVARAHRIDLSAALEASLEQQTRKRRREEWLRQNAAAMDAYNREVERLGTFGNELRSF